MDKAKLRRAIEVKRSKDANPDNMTLFLRQMASEMLQPSVDELMGNLRKEIESRLPALLQEHIEDLRGEPGRPGVDAKVDIEDVAKKAAALVPSPIIVEDSVVKKVLSKIPKANHEEIARKAATMIELPSTQDLVQSVLEKLPKSEQITLESLLNQIHAADAPIKISAIKGLDKMLRDVQRNSGKMIHGGGMTLAAGVGQTLTRNQNGTWTLSGGAASLTPIAITGVINDSNMSFTAPSQPTLLNINGAFYQQTGGAITWTYVLGTITLSIPVGVGGSIFGI